MCWRAFASGCHRSDGIGMRLGERGLGGQRRQRHAPLELDTDLTRRWSGVVAATPELAEELAITLRAAHTSAAQGAC
jgi:hypothetical protein